MKTDELPTVDADVLEDVTGGAKTTNDAQIAAALQGISSSLASLKQDKNQQSPFAQLLPILALSGGFGGKGKGGACPCGCGMANCIRR
jgi:hypothetical protein